MKFSIRSLLFVMANVAVFLTLVTRSPDWAQIASAMSVGLALAVFVAKKGYATSDDKTMTRMLLAILASHLVIMALASAKG